MIMVGMKCELQEYKCFIKCIKIDISASICSNFNSYLKVMSFIYIPHLHLIIIMQIICQSYKLTTENCC